MFGKKKEKCPICGSPISELGNQLKDGKICGICGRFCELSPLASVDDVRKLIEQNHERFKNFSISLEYHVALSGYFYIDAEKQQCFYSSKMPPKVEPIVFSFNDVESAFFEMVGQKTITKSSGGIGRAVVGGALFGPTGAIVGAATAKTTEKKTGGTPVYHLILNFGGCRTKLDLVNPDLQAITFVRETFPSKSEA